MRAPVHSARIAARLTASIATTAGRAARCASGSMRPAVAQPRLAPLHDRIGSRHAARCACRSAPPSRRPSSIAPVERRRDVAEGVAHVELEADDAAVDQRGHVLDACPRRAGRRGRNRHAPSRPRCACLSASTSAVPVGGMVFGMSNTVVTPPNAAAAVPVCQVLLVRIAGIAEVHVDVDGAGQHVQAAASSVSRAGGIAVVGADRDDARRP